MADWSESEIPMARIPEVVAPDDGARLFHPAASGWAGTQAGGEAVA